MMAVQIGLNKNQPNKGKGKEVTVGEGVVEFGGSPMIKFGLSESDPILEGSFSVEEGPQCQQQVAGVKEPFVKRKPEKKNRDKPKKGGVAW